MVGGSAPALAQPSLTNLLGVGAQILNRLPPDRLPSPQTNNAGIADPATGPSYDCGKARQVAAIVVCASLELSTLDRQLAAAYGAAVAKADAPAAASLKATQREWIGARNACGADAGCITALYQRRLAVLVDMGGSTTVGAASPEGSADASSFTLLNGFDLPNGDYRSGMNDPSLRGISMGACQQQCAVEARCQAFTYNANVSVCILKNAVRQSAPFAGAISGIKVRAPASTTAGGGEVADQGGSSVNSMQPVASATAAGSVNPLNGTWQGSYSCGAATTTFTLVLQADSSDIIDGEFRFAAAGGPGAAGAYHIRGRYSPDDRSFNLSPTAWIDRPAGWTAGVITGTSRGNGLSINGTLRGCNGGTGGAEFVAERAGGLAGAPNGTIAVAADMPVPPTGGPFEGRWTGSIACGDPMQGHPKQNLPLDIDMLQDGDTVTAAATVSSPAGVKRAVMSGTVGADGTLVLKRRIMLPFENGYVPWVPESISFKTTGGMAIEAALGRMPTGWGCKNLSVQRTGPPAVPSAAKLAGLVGTWAGYDYGVSRQGLDAPNPSKLPNSIDSQARMEIDSGSGQAYGLYTWSYPADQPPVKQDHLEFAIRPLLVTDDGRVVFTSTVFKAAEGAFRHYDGTTILFELSFEPGGTLLVERVPDDLHQYALRLKRVSADAVAAANEGEAPPVPLPSSIGGLLGSAGTLEEQCRVLHDWAQPVVATVDFGDHSTADAELRGVLPLFDDSSFTPVFGLSYSLTTRDQRKAVWNLGRFTCPRRTGLGGFFVSSVWDEAFLANGINKIPGMAANQREVQGMGPIGTGADQRASARCEFGGPVVST